MKRGLFWVFSVIVVLCGVLCVVRLYAYYVYWPRKEAKLATVRQSVPFAWGDSLADMMRKHGPGEAVASTEENSAGKLIYFRTVGGRRQMVTVNMQLDHTSSLLNPVTRAAFVEVDLDRAVPFREALEELPETRGLCPAHCRLKVVGDSPLRSLTVSTPSFDVGGIDYAPGANHDEALSLSAPVSSVFLSTPEGSKQIE